MAVVVAVTVSEAGAVAVAGLAKRFLNHIHQDFSINVWGYGHSCGGAAAAAAVVAADFAVAATGNLFWMF